MIDLQIRLKRSAALPPQEFEDRLGGHAEQAGGLTLIPLRNFKGSPEERLASLLQVSLDGEASGRLGDRDGRTGWGCQLEVFGADFLPAGQEGRPLDDVREFADVA